MRTICCVCQRIIREDDRKAPLDPDGEEMVSHAYCPNCLHELKLQLEWQYANIPSQKGRRLAVERKKLEGPDHQAQGLAEGTDE